MGTWVLVLGLALIVMAIVIVLFVFLDWLFSEDEHPDMHD